MNTDRTIAGPAGEPDVVPASGDHGSPMHD